MKMIYVGTLSTKPDRDSGWIDAFASLGLDVTPYCSIVQDQMSGLIGKVARRFNIGRANQLMQDGLIRLVQREKPDWVHFRLPIEFSRKAIIELKNKGITVTQYFNDDPFSKRTPLGLHWKFRRALTAYDGHFVYRTRNIENYLNAGATQVQHCPPTYDPRRHYLSERLPNGQFLADAAFIGHWEDDWRTNCLDTLVRNKFQVILKGGLWNEAIKTRSLVKLAPITHAFGEEYNHIYANVNAGLCFFSKINNDTWTERALEIVAIGGVLVCERTEEAQQYFKDRVEAYFFSTEDELIEIVEELKSNLSKREEVRIAGYKRLISEPNSIRDRAKQIIEFVTSSCSSTNLPPHSKLL